MTAKTAKPAAPRARKTAAPAKSTPAKPAAPAVVEPVAPIVITWEDRVTSIADRNDALKKVAGTVIADGADAYWTARTDDMIGSDKRYATEGALFEGALHFQKSQGSTLKRLAVTVHVHGFVAESPEFRVVRDRGGMGWAKFLTPVAGEIPALTEAQRTALANVARYNDGPETFVAGTAAKIVAGTVQIDDAGKPVSVVLPDPRQANPNDGTGTGGDDAENDAAKSLAPKDVANPVAQANALARLLLTVTDPEVLTEVFHIVGDAVGERLAQIGDADDAETATA